MIEESLVSPPPRDALIGQNPRDEIILLRKKSLQEIREAKKLKATGAHDEILRKFSKQFFQDDAIFDRLGAPQKKELAKLCASHCRRWLASLLLPIGSSFLTILFLGIFASSSWFMALLLWAIVSFIGICSIGVPKDTSGHVNIEDFWTFLEAQRKINQTGNAVNKSPHLPAGR